MRQVIAACALFAAPVLGQAQSICPAIEYAELRDTSRSSLEMTYCQYDIRAAAWHELAILEAKYGRFAAAERAQASGATCSHEAERIWQVLRSKHRTAPPQCPKPQFNR